MWRGLYHFFFIDTHGKVSHTKLFSVVASLLILGLFPIVVLKELNVNVELFLVVGAMFLANRTINKALELKSGGKTKSE